MSVATSYLCCSQAPACGTLQLVRLAYPSSSLPDNFVAFLPSTFAMYTTMLASSYWIFPVSLTSSRLPWSFPQAFTRTLFATMLFATGAIFGWPFSILLAVPFVFEELVLRGADILEKHQTVSSWHLLRLTRLMRAGLASALLLVRRDHRTVGLS